MTSLFDRPEYLALALPAIPATVFVLVRWKRMASLVFPALLNTGPRPAVSIFRAVVVRTVCYALAWMLVACAFASPRWGTKLLPVRQEGASVLFVLDISRSMTVGDVAPDRLSYAAEYASVLADRFVNARVGIVLAKGAGILAIPLTADRRSVRDLLNAVSPAMLSSAGSNPGSGLEAALASFPASSAASRTIVLFTDGDETSGSLLEAARSVQKSGASLVVVGIGTEEGEAIDVYPGASEPTFYTTRLQEDFLRQAVRIAGNGSLYVNGSDAGSALDVISLVDGSQNGSRMVYSRTGVYRYGEVLAAAFLLFAAGCVAGGRVWRKRI